MIVRVVVGLFTWARVVVAPWIGAPEVLAPLLLVVLVASGLGDALGLPTLVFPEPKYAGDQFLAGASIAFLFLEIAFVSYLLERSWFVTWAGARRFAFFKSGAFAPYALLVLALPVIALCTFAAAEEERLAWFAGVLFMAVLFVLARMTIARGIITQLQRATDGVLATANASPVARMARAARPASMTRDDEVMHALQLVVVALVLLVYVLACVSIALYEGELTPALVLCGLAALVTSTLGALRNYTTRWYNGALLVALVLAAMFVPTCRGVNQYTQLIPEDGVWPVYDDARPADDVLLPDDKVFDAWRTQAARVAFDNERVMVKPTCGGADAPHLFLVAVSGGGIRAAGWAASVLQSLEHDLDGDDNAGAFASHVRLIAGASGGMVGAGAWVGSLTDARGTHATLHPDVDARDAVMTDALPSVARALAFAPFLDRGRALERAWTTSSFGLGQSFEQMRDGERAGWRPSLVFTPMSVEDGRRVFVSNLDLHKMTTSAGRLLYPIGKSYGERYSLNGVQLFRLFPDSGPKLQLATAARMSASFPYVSAAAELPTLPPVRLVDAGYYDNYGVDVLAHWLLEHESDVKDCTAGVAILEIRDESGYGRRNEISSPDAKRTDERKKLLASEIGSPPEALLVAREASMSFRNDELLELLHRVFNGNDERFFASIVFELQETAPLSWALTDADRDELAMTDKTTQTAVAYEAARKALETWLAEPKKPYASAQQAPPASAE